MPSHPPRPGKCVHCLKDNIQRTWDHVFPKAWYPSSTPPNLERWQIPACLKCNQRYGKLEDDLLIRLGMCVNPTIAQAAGIADKALRALNPRLAKNAKDAVHRYKRALKLLRLLKPVADVPHESIIPVARQPDWPDPQHAITIPRASLQALAEKISRGIFFIEDDQYIEPPYEVTHYVLPEAPHEDVLDLLERFGKVYSREPGIVVTRAVAEDDRISAIFKFEIWGQFRMFSVVDNPAASPLDQQWQQ
jgi:hypothetical protein